VSTADLLDEAVAELYTADPDGFTERRGALAARARAAGDAAAAKSIAQLRKPTRSAWAINQVVRADPSVPSRLAALGDQLRAAERSMDGTKIRELSLARRQLIDALVADALAVSGQQPPPAALREEVTSTFGAALADPQFAEQLAAGILLRAERRAGFGSGAGAGAELMLLKSPGRGGRPAPAKARPSTAKAQAAAGAQPAKAQAAAGAQAAKAQAAAGKARERAAARARAERARQQALTDAERAVAEAGRAVAAAVTAEQEQEATVRRIEEQLAESRLRLSELRLAARRAKAAQRTARERLDRFRG
jgi:hypothetical protein